jgi:hypothetical protein
MRTTINLDDGLLQDAKRRAAESGTTLSAFITSALREALNASPRVRRKRSFHVVVYGSKGTLPGVTLERIQEILDEEETARLRQRSKRR